MMKVLIALALLPSTALAQGIDAHDLYLAPQQGDVRSAFTVLTPTGFERGDWYASGLIEYGHEVLVLHQQLDGGEEQELTALGSLGALNLAAGYALHDLVRLELAMPVVITSAGLDGSNGFGLGDLRLGLTVPVYHTDALGVAIAPWLDLPTGDASAFLGREGLGGGLKVAAAYTTGGWTLGGSLGTALQKAIELKNLNGADQLQLGLSGGYAFNDKRGLTAELVMAPALSKNDATGAGFPVETRLVSRHGLSDGSNVVWGVAKGVSAGVGAADWRLFLGGSFGSSDEAPVPDAVVQLVDTDGDGIEDSLDACPNEAEVINDYLDTDGCPDAATSLTVVPTWEGKPLTGAATKVKLGDARPVEFTAAAGPWRKSALEPGTTASGSASYGGCLTGEGALSLSEGDNDLEIPLTRHTNQVTWEVRRADGTLIPNATVSFQGAGQNPCVPSEATVLGDGTGTSEVGLGEAIAIISAPGYKTTQVPLVVVAGDPMKADPLTLDKTQIEVRKTTIDTLIPVYFDTAKATIQDRSFQLLDEMAATLIANPQWLKVEIGGHTDADGAEDMNLSLSQSRAEAVRVYLVGKGVQASRLSAKGYGEAVPVVANDTAEHKAKNRRVEFKILKQAE
ncbi:MAG: OmpA family protein [Deltaproteobacteria bacterium]|nr:OmpA family protein [Deltaproteobacteria bacterium]